MSEIALYDLLRRIPEVSNDEAKAAADDVASAKEVVTKDYLDARFARVEASISNMQTELKYQQWFLGLLFVLQVAILARLFMS